MYISIEQFISIQYPEDKKILSRNNINKKIKFTFFVHQTTCFQLLYREKNKKISFLDTGFCHIFNHYNTYIYYYRNVWLSESGYSLSISYNFRDVRPSVSLFLYGFPYNIELLCKMPKFIKEQTDRRTDRHGISFYICFFKILNLEV